MLERRARYADRLRGYAQAARVQSLHRVTEPLPLFSNQMLGGELHVGQRDLRRSGRAQPHLVFGLPRCYTRSVRRHNEERQPSRPRTRVVRRTHHHQEDICHISIGHPCLRAVEHPVGTVPLPTRPHVRQIGPGVRLRYAERRQQLSSRHRLEPPLLLFGRAVQLEDATGERVVDAQCNGDTRVCGGDLLDHHQVGKRVEPQPVHILRNEKTQKPQLAQSLDGVRRVCLVLVPLSCMRGNLALREIAGRLNEFPTTVFAHEALGDIRSRHRTLARSCSPAVQQQPSSEAVGRDDTCRRRTLDAAPRECRGTRPGR